jgi:FKBP-type peptidyl-prolyl cis-trans isomerase
LVSLLKKFNAPKVFETELENVAFKEKEYLKKLETLKVAYLKDKGIDKATETASGLKVLELKKGTGKKFNRAIVASMIYSVSLASGKLIQSTEGKEPFAFTLDKQPMIAGVTEALLEMREGDKKRLFIPYYLGYGEETYGPFPQKSDIVFDLELIKVGK